MAKSPQAAGRSPSSNPSLAKEVDPMSLHVVQPVIPELRGMSTQLRWHVPLSLVDTIRAAPVGSTNARHTSHEMYVAGVPLCIVLNKSQERQGLISPAGHVHQQQPPAGRRAANSPWYLSVFLQVGRPTSDMVNGSFGSAGFSSAEREQVSSLWERRICYSIEMLRVPQQQHQAEGKQTESKSSPLERRLKIAESTFSENRKVFGFREFAPFDEIKKGSNFAFEPRKMKFRSYNGHGVEPDGSVSLAASRQTANTSTMSSDPTNGDLVIEETIVGFGHVVVEVKLNVQFSLERIHRQLQASVATSRRDLNRVGLLNHGTTCYLNVLLQCLFHVSFFRTEVYRLHEWNPKISEAAVALQGIFFMLERSPRPVSTMALVKATRTNPSIQQDAHEFLSEFFLHRVLKHVTDLFSFKVKYVTQCTEVDFSSASEERLFELSVSVGDDCPRLEDAIAKELAPEPLSDLYDTGHAEFKRQKAFRQMHIVSVPSVLFVHIKRFDIYAKKIHASQHVPEVLTLVCQGKQHRLVLHSAVIHHGTTTTSGHYTAFVRMGSPDGNSKHSTVHHFDDECVEKVSASELFDKCSGRHWASPSSSTYVLTYIREDCYDAATTSFQPAPAAVEHHHMPMLRRVMAATSNRSGLSASSSPSNPPSTPESRAFPRDAAWHLRGGDQVAKLYQLLCDRRRHIIDPESSDLFSALFASKAQSQKPTQPNRDLPPLFKRSPSTTGVGSSSDIKAAGQAANSEEDYVRVHFLTVESLARMDTQLYPHSDVLMLNDARYLQQEQHLKRRSAKAAVANSIPHGSATSPGNSVNGRGTIFQLLQETHLQKKPAEGATSRGSDMLSADPMKTINIKPGTPLDTMLNDTQTFEREANNGTPIRLQVPPNMIFSPSSHYSSSSDDDDEMNHEQATNSAQSAEADTSSGPILSITVPRSILITELRSRVVKELEDAKLAARKVSVAGSDSQQRQRFSLSDRAMLYQFAKRQNGTWRPSVPLYDEIEDFEAATAVTDSLATPLRQSSSGDRSSATTSIPGPGIRPGGHVDPLEDRDDDDGADTPHLAATNVSNISGLSTLRRNQDIAAVLAETRMVQTPPDPSSGSPLRSRRLSDYLTGVPSGSSSTGVIPTITLLVADPLPYVLVDPHTLRMSFNSTLGPNGPLGMDQLSAGDRIDRSTDDLVVSPMSTLNATRVPGSPNHSSLQSRQESFVMPGQGSSVSVSGPLEGRGDRSTPMEVQMASMSSLKDIDAMNVTEVPQIKVNMPTMGPRSDGSTTPESHEDAAEASMSNTHNEHAEQNEFRRSALGSIELSLPSFSFASKVFNNPTQKSGNAPVRVLVDATVTLWETTRDNVSTLVQQANGTSAQGGGIVSQIQARRELTHIVYTSGVQVIFKMYDAARSTIVPLCSVCVPLRSTLIMIAIWLMDSGTIMESDFPSVDNVAEAALSRLTLDLRRQVLASTLSFYEDIRPERLEPYPLDTIVENAELRHGDILVVALPSAQTLQQKLTQSQQHFGVLGRRPSEGAQLASLLISNLRHAKVAVTLLTSFPLDAFSPRIAPATTLVVEIDLLFDTVASVESRILNKLHEMRSCWLGYGGTINATSGSPGSTKGERRKTISSTCEIQLWSSYSSSTGNLAMTGVGGVESGGEELFPSRGAAFSHRVRPRPVPGVPMLREEVEDRLLQLQAVVDSALSRPEVIGTPQCPVSILSAFFPTELALVLQWHSYSGDPQQKPRGPPGVARSPRASEQKGRKLAGLTTGDSTLPLLSGNWHLFAEVQNNPRAETSGALSPSPPKRFVDLIVHWMGGTQHRIATKIHLESVPLHGHPSLLFGLLAAKLDLLRGMRLVGSTEVAMAPLDSISDMNDRGNWRVPSLEKHSLIPYLALAVEVGSTITRVVTFLEALLDSAAPVPLHVDGGILPGEYKSSWGTIQDMLLDMKCASLRPCQAATPESSAGMVFSMKSHATLRLELVPWATLPCPLRPPASLVSTQDERLVDELEVVASNLVHFGSAHSFQQAVRSRLSNPGPFPAPQESNANAKSGIDLGSGTYSRSLDGKDEPDSLLASLISWMPRAYFVVSHVDLHHAQYFATPILLPVPATLTLLHRELQRIFGPGAVTSSASHPGWRLSIGINKSDYFEVTHEAELYEKIVNRCFCFHIDPQEVPVSEPPSGVVGSTGSIVLPPAMPLPPSEACDADTTSPQLFPRMPANAAKNLVQDTERASWAHAVQIAQDAPELAGDLANSIASEKVELPLKLLLYHPNTTTTDGSGTQMSPQGQMSHSNSPAMNAASVPG